MGKERLAAFSDGVIAIIITIMVLELRVPHGGDLGRAAPAGAGLPQLRPQLRLRRHLLEQPSPPAGGHGAGERRHPVGEHAPAVLAVAGAVRDGLDGGEPFRARADGRLRGGAAGGLAGVLAAPAGDPGRAGAGFAAGGGGGAATSRENCRRSSTRSPSPSRSCGPGSRTGCMCWWRCCGWSRTAASSGLWRRRKASRSRPAEGL